MSCVPYKVFINTIEVVVTYQFSVKICCGYLLLLLENTFCVLIHEAIPPLFGTPDSDLLRGYSVRRTLVRGTPTKVQMVRVRRILQEKILKIRGTRVIQ